MSAGKLLRIAKNFTLPLDTITSTQAVLGIKGSGKTNTAVVMVEELIRLRQQVVVIDPTDVWWGLKSSKDGTKPGLPVVVLGGRRADLPLDEHAGATVADFAVDHGANLILSLRHLSNGAKRRFVTAFANRLYARKGGDDPTPLMVVIDEAHLVVPQRVGAAEAEMVGAIQQLVRQGRASGIGVTLIDQRAASVNKDVLTQVELLVCHRTIGPQDRKALEAWVEQHDAEGSGPEFFKQLASLPQGTAWYWSPGWLQVFERVAVNARQTFDSSRTPKPGEKIAPPKAVAEVDLEQLKTKMSATLEKAKADDPKLLRARIVELERAAAKKGTPAAPPIDKAALNAEYARGYDTGRAAERIDAHKFLRSAQVRIAGLHHDAGTAVSATTRLLQDFAEVLEAKPTTNGNQPTPRTITVTKVVGPPSTMREAVGAAIANEIDREVMSGITGPEQRILDGIAWMESVGVPEPQQAAVAFLARYSGSSNGAYKNPRARLAQRGMVRYLTDDRIALTDEGRAAAVGPPNAGNDRQLHEIVCAKLPGPEQKILRQLLHSYPQGITNEDLARGAGYSGARNGAYKNPRARLRTFGLIEYMGGDSIRAAHFLFPNGR